jgi:rhodanese-related sulfurtransferase
MPDLATISTEALRRAIERGEPLLLINVQPAAYFEKTHLPGSSSVPAGNDDFLLRIRAIASDDRRTRIVLHSANEQCDEARAAAQRLWQDGFANVAVYEAGIEGWRAAGGPVETGVARRPLSTGREVDDAST